MIVVDSCSTDLMNSALPGYKKGMKKTAVAGCEAGWLDSLTRL
jgi:hypothetical protein